MLQLHISKSYLKYVENITEQSEDIDLSRFTDSRVNETEGKDIPIGHVRRFRNRPYCLKQRSRIRQMFEE